MAARASFAATDYRRAAVVFAWLLGPLLACNRPFVLAGAEPPMPMPADGEDGPFPEDLHNLFVIIVVAILAAWAAKVSWQLYCAAEMHHRLSQSRAVVLQGMSVYSNELQQILRHHFNQILRIHNSRVPPALVARHALSVHLHPESIQLSEGVALEAGGVRFTVDAALPCRIKLFWGVSTRACNELVQRQSASDGRGSSVSDAEGSPGRSSRRWLPGTGSPQESSRSLLEMEKMEGGALPGLLPGINYGDVNVFSSSQYAGSTTDLFLPAGNGQQVVCTVAGLHDPASLRLGDEAVVPLAIVICAQRRTPQDLGTVQDRPVFEVYGQMSLVRFRRGASEDTVGAPEVIRQLTIGDSAPAQEVNGIFGFEEAGEFDCEICYFRPKNVLLLPCRHCSVCHPCLRSLRDERCPLCRASLTSYVILPLPRRGARPQDEAATASLAAPPHPADGSGIGAASGPASDSPGGWPPGGGSGGGAVGGGWSSGGGVLHPPGGGGGSTGGGGRRGGAGFTGILPVPPAHPLAGESPAASIKVQLAQVATGAQAREVHVTRPRGTNASAAALRSTARGHR